jgi:hypothetical protein
MNGYESLVDDYAHIEYRSYAADLVEHYNAKAEMNGQPRKFVPGRMCLSCGVRVSIYGTLPCDH